jgi:putative ABC transport system permease protein
VFGGIAGILTGWGVGVVASIYLSKLMKIPFTATVPVLYAGIAVTFCIVIGLLFGLWPAFRASQLDPVVAMRKE